MTNHSKKRKFLATSLTATMVAAAVAPVAPVAAAGTFPDVSESQVGEASVKAVDALVTAGMLKGYDDGTFKPGASVTRAEAAQLVTRLLDLSYGEEANTTDFTDVKDNVWYTGAINSLVNAGVVKGKTTDTFEPGSTLSRAEFALMIVKAYGLEDTDVSDVELPFSTDDVKEGVWYTDAVKIAYDAGLIKGKSDGIFAPGEEMRRIDFARLAVAAEYAFGTVLPKPEEEAELTVESVSAINNTTVEVKFNTAVDAVTAENFSIEGGKVNAAKLSDDKKTATLSVSGLGYNTEYTLVTKDIKVDAEVVEFGTKKFTTPAVTQQWSLDIVPKHAEVVADGADNTVVEFRLLGANGEVDKTAKDVVLDISASFGNLANSRVTIKDGVGSVVLASEFSTKEVTSKITAKVIEASEDHKELIGQIAGEGTVKFVPTSATTDPDAVTFVDAESNQADRVVLYFDKEVSPATFLKTTKDGKFVTEVRGSGNNEYTAQVLKDSVKLAIHQDDKDGDQKEIIGLRSVEGNAKAIEVILAKNKADGTANHLVDNSRVFVKAKIGKTDNEKTFTLTDARQPEVTSVVAEDLKTLKVKFSESIHEGKFTIDGGLLDGRDFTVKHGDFDAKTGVDNRDVATIKLGNYVDGTPGNADNSKTGKQRYFVAGNHTLVVTNLKDFAGITDPQNVSTNQSLGFTVAEDKTAPIAQTIVESPEQFRISFDKDIIDEPSNDDVAKAFQIYDETSSKYVDVFTSTGALTSAGGDVFVAGTTAAGLFQTVQYDNDFVIELKTDWTKLLKKTNDAYYNYKFQFKFAKDAFTNEANGIGSAEMELPLNYSGSPLNAADNKSPEISTIEQLSDLVTFKVGMNEPVKLVKDADATESKDDAGATLGKGQTSLPITLVEFQGKDKDGKHVVIPGKVIGYSDKQKGADKAFDVAVADGQTGLQTLVDDHGYSTDWKVVVKSISDDVGNTAATLDKDFTLIKEEQSDVFEIIAAENDNASLLGGAVVKAFNHEVGSTENDRIEITFTKAVNHTDGTSNVTNPSLWTLNGQKLSDVATITAVDADGDADNGNEKVIITFNNADVLKSSSNTISVNKDIVSKDGTKLTGFNEIVAVTENIAAPIVTTGITATPVNFANGTEETLAVKAVYSFDVTADSTTAGDITLENVATSDVTVAVTDSNTKEEIAAAIKTAVEGAAGSLYDVEVTDAKVTLTAKTAAAVTDPTATRNTTNATVSTVNEDVEGVDFAAGVKATADLAITGTATATGKVAVLVDGVAIKTINVDKDQTADQVAAVIAAQVYTDYTATAAGATVTFTSKVAGVNTLEVTLQDVK